MNKLEKTFVKGLYYTDNEIGDAIEQNKLLNLDMDMSNVCNLKCIYCDKTHVGEKHCKKKGELTLDESLNIIKQAKKLGCKNLQFIGAGEPMLDPNFWKIIEYASKLKIISVVYTNGTMIRKESAKKLFNLRTSIVLKYNSFESKVQDKMVGTKNYSVEVDSALNELIKIGFNNESPTRLAIDCVATKLNKNHVMKVFEFCRENNISPQFSGLIPHGEALERELVLDRKDCIKLYDEAQLLDKKYRLKYPYQLPFMGGFQCKQVKYGVYVDIEGNVWECNAGELHLGNIRKTKLKDLWLSKKAIKFRKNWTCGNCHIREKYWRIQDGKK
ncbi:hypothetical protein CMI46_01465 [Candidatus Pacearchaeota archaeon]|nr:hypothetical protein [Candidatus Pacearchaeota archaeon]|tara:strand:- start:22600 stop:23586 length:987 start_codon:yes stop_codon:yes gene_type:complete